MPATQKDKEEMLKFIGCDNINDLFHNIPSELILKDGANIPEGLSELEVFEKMKRIADKNTVFSSIFRGAGAYDHYIPAIVSSVVSKEEFVTSYTPYQPEISQGILQSIFEYQTMICEITGMDVSNASVYDGASAAAEAAAMCRDRKRTKTLISATAHPDVIETVKTYCWASDSQLVIIPQKDGITDLDALKDLLDETVSGVYIAQPNFFGNIEPASEIGEIVHAAGAKYIMGVNPIAMAILPSPMECGADVAVGEGQPLGMPLSFGGPYLGFMAAKSSMARKLPGRIVGQTNDAKGNRAFVLTLQAREQHIRREKASSNVCSNQALCALTAGVYLSTLGQKGLEQAALLSMSKAHYLAQELCKIPGFDMVHNGEYFHEFVTTCPVDADMLNDELSKKGILGGLHIDEGILWCTTEKNSKAQIDTLISAIKEVCTK